MRSLTAFYNTHDLTRLFCVCLQGMKYLRLTLRKCQVYNTILLVLLATVNIIMLYVNLQNLTHYITDSVPLDQHTISVKLFVFSTSLSPCL